MTEPPYYDAAPPPWPPIHQPPGVPAGDPIVSPDYSGWWQRGVSVAKAAWRPLLVLQAIGAVIGLALRGPAALFQATSFGSVSSFGGPTTTDRTVNPVKLLAGVGLGLVGTVLAVLVAALVTLAVVRVTIVTVTGGRATVGEALHGALPRVLPLIGWQLLAGLIIVGGICLCLLPGLYFAAVFLVLPVVVTLERGGVIARCFRLFHRDLGASLARVATVGGIWIAGGVVASAVAGGVLAGASSRNLTPALVASTLVATTIAVVVQAALGILLGPLITLAYADMRARVEPLSASVLLQELNR